MLLNLVQWQINVMTSLAVIDQDAASQRDVWLRMVAKLERMGEG